ncbi:MAG TPA: hypothetical protein PKA62_18145, partial [Thermoanaerobaculia bacterium]|nr:hypothetical protein [Thermoanaerobaculia bacterium]
MRLGEIRGPVQREVDRLPDAAVAERPRRRRQGGAMTMMWSASPGSFCRMRAVLGGTCALGAVALAAPALAQNSGP